MSDLFIINLFFSTGNITCVLCFAYIRAFLVDVSGSEVLLDTREVALLCAVPQRTGHALSLSLFLPFVSEFEKEKASLVRL